jgi:hypothetical protein
MFNLKPDKLFPNSQSENKRILKLSNGYWTVKEYYGTCRYLSFDYWKYTLIMTIFQKWLVGKSKFIYL